MALPLLGDGRVFGALTIYSRQPDPFSEDEVVLLSELAGDVAFGIRSLRVRAAHREAEEALASSEARYRSLFSTMTEGFAVHEILTDEAGEPRDYRFLEVNPAFEQLTGLSRDDVLGRRMSEVLPGEDPLWVKVYGRVALTGEPAHLLHYAPVLRRHYEVFAYRTAPRQFAALFMDATERVETERLASAINAVNDIIHATLDADEILRSALTSAAAALGCDTAAVSLYADGAWAIRHVHGMPPEVVGARMSEDEERHAMLALKAAAPVAIDDAFADPRVNTELMRARGVRSLLVVPIVSRHEGFGVIFFNYQASPFAFLDRHVDFAKKLAASLSMALENSRLYADVRYELEERKHAEAALRETHARAAWLARLPEENPRPVARISADGRVLYGNPESARPDGWALRVGEPVPATMLDLITKALESGEVQQQDLELVDRVYSIQAAPIPAEAYANLYGLDITDRRLAEEALAQSERRFRLLFEGIQEAFLLQEIITDSAGEPVDLRYLEANPAAELQLGRPRSELVGRMRSEVQGPLDAEAVRVMRQAATEKRPAHFERHDPERGRWYEVLLYSPRPGQVATLNLDITERKLGEQVLKARGAVTQVLAEGADPESAGPALLEHLAGLFDAAGGELWVVSPADARLRRVSAWQREGGGLEVLIEAGENLAFAPGEGVPGRVWAEGRSLWFDGASEFPAAPRTPAFRRLDPGGVLGVPIRVGAHTFGALLFVTRRAPHDQLIAAGEILGSQVGEFLRRKHAESEILRNSAVLAGMNRIFQATLAAESEAELAAVCLSAAEEVTGARFGFVGEINEETGRLDDIAISDPGWDVCGMGIARGERAAPAGFEIHGIYGRVLIDGRSLLTNDPASHPDRVGFPEGHPGLESFLGAPLVRDGKTIGMIAVGNRPGGFREEDRASLEALARATTEAFMRRRAELALARSTERFRLLSDVAASLLSAPDPQPIVNDLCVRVMAHLDCQVFFNFVGDPSGRLRLNAYAGIPEEEARRIGWLDYGVAVCGCVAEQGVRIVVEDVQHSSDQRADLARSFGVQAYACYPLLAGDRVIGTLSFGTKKRTRFAPDELALMKTVADQVAVAMERIQIQREIAQLNLDLQRRVSELQTFFDTAPIGLAIALDPEGRHIRANRANEEMYGLPAGAELSMAADTPPPFRVFADGRELDLLELPMQRAVRGETVAGQQFEVERADGSRIAVYASSRPLFDENGRPRGAVGGFLDITALRRAEESLRESEERFRAVASSTPDHVLVQDRDLRYTLVVNPQLGLIQEDMIGKTDQDILSEEDAEALTRIKRQVLETGQPIPVETAVASKRGQRDFFEGVYIPRRDDHGQVVGLIGYFRNVTERKHAEQALRESEERYRALVEMSPEAVLVHQGGRIVYANPVCLALYGGAVPEDLIGTPILDRVHPDDRAMVDGRIRIVYEGGTAPRREVRMLRLDGREVLSESTAVRIEYGGQPAVQAIIRDITERRKLEERLAQAQKMEAIGLLAGGVAHDFNNLLVGVIGNASLAQDMVAPGSKVAPFLDRIVRTGEQAAHLTRQLLAYAGKGQIVVEALDLSQVAHNGADLVRASIPSKVALHLDLAPGPPPVSADRGQLHQVFMNLVINAAEAIGSGAGRISVRTGVRDVDAPGLRTSSGPELPPGRHVFLEVTDDGCGMDEDTLARIFDPFFTTKFLGRGLGLAAVAGIVRTHGGGIQVESMPGQGSRFTVLLPALEEAVPEEQAAAAAGGRDLSGEGRILLVDDEEIVLELAQAALQRHGYDVLIAASGPAALRVFEREAAHVDLVILDLSMPGMGGDEVLPELKRIRPDARVVISSGYSQDDAMKYFRGLPAAGFIQKPYTAAQLAAAVKRALGG
ncbi:MAG TPA: GAF domain-containing protein [Terriglobales bacterium]|nr:GAF domain-containing protein [Terriglobales bacterium]